MENRELVQVNVEKIVASKSGKFAHYIPKFVINYLRKIVHEDEINDVLQRSYNKYYGSDFADFLLEDFGVTYTIKHEERIPQTGKLIVVSNHPLGGFDGIVLISIISKYLKNIKFPVNDLLMHIPNLQSLFVPINKTGNNNINLAKSFEEIFNKEHTILYFPSGLCSRKINGKIVDLPWKKTFVSKAKQYGYDILPLRFEGRNSNFFYNLANIRKKIGIKFNIEMLYLADEFFKQKNAHFNIIVGNVIANKHLYESDDLKMANKIRELVYQL